ncbi:MAG TPA: DUF4402 domain-containing protein [Prolixibacteraceae bacterium]|jgi:hypothetical protein
MKTTIALLVAIFFGLTLGGTKVNGQTVAIGHVCAEVVESVSVASATISDFELATSTSNITASLASETLNLGSIVLNSGKDVTCNVVLQSATLSDAQGNGFTIEPAVQNDMLASAAKSNGSQTIQLGGTTNLADNQASGQYEGSYAVIFAYN